MNRTRPRVGTLLARALATQFLTPGYCRCSDRSPSLRLVHATIFLILLLAAARGSDTSASCLGGPSLRGRVPCTALCSPGAFVRQGKKGGDRFHLVCRQLFQHLLITDPCRKAVIIDASEIRGMVPRTLVKRDMKARRVSAGCRLTTWRWASMPCC
jgi:hypothetical protein